MLCAIAEHYEKIAPLCAGLRNIATTCDYLRAAIRFRKPFVETIPIDIEVKIEQFKVYTDTYNANKKFYTRLAKRTHCTYHILPLRKATNELAEIFN
ncbi:hypothetical protein [Helicobacter suis]|uniref:hypothetical protein n=1 Tax=Helicobacter suis TaxID=104628 RepID=UPI0003168D3A|nr:hypothetical protein [Helicobacter suis]